MVKSPKGIGKHLMMESSAYHENGYDSKKRVQSPKGSNFHEIEQLPLAPSNQNLGKGPPSSLSSCFRRRPEINIRNPRIWAAPLAIQRSILADPKLIFLKGLASWMVSSMAMNSSWASHLTFVLGGHESLGMLMSTRQPQKESKARRNLWSKRFTPKSQESKQTSISSYANCQTRIVSTRLDQTTASSDAARRARITNSRWVLDIGTPETVAVVRNPEAAPKNHRNLLHKCALM